MTTLPGIVGVGASAGGLNALEAFFRQVRPDSGLAYIVVQHLDPTHPTLLPELLQRITHLTVHEAQQDMPVVADTLYVIPPDAELRLADGRLQLGQPAEPRGMRLPVNVLFASLAEAMGERAIGVVLSGMGADGTLGVQAIKAMGGLTLAQQPDSAQFDSMPRNAIATGCVDIVDRAEALPARIQECVKRLPMLATEPERQAPEITREPDPDTPAPTGPIDRILALLRQHTGHDFSLYKQSTLNRRIERRMSIHGVNSLARYAELLETTAQELHLLFKELLIGVTSFFRDPEYWTYLAETALAPLLARAAALSPPLFRAWVVGCSTGEEAYTLAMACCEAADSLPAAARPQVQIFASDMSPDAIATARRGEYPLTIADQVSAARLERFFTRRKRYYSINQGIREMVLFASHDVVLDPPFTKLDLISCRNLLIYFDASLQRRLIPLFHYCLRADGLLVLGSSETVGRQTHLFTPTTPALRIYTRGAVPAIEGPGFLLQSFPPLSMASREHAVPNRDLPESQVDNLQTAADLLLLQTYAPAAVLLNPEGDILYVSGRTGRYLEPPAGKANWNIHAMARPGLRDALAQGLRQAQAQSDPVQIYGLQLEEENAGATIDVSIQTLQEPSALRGKILMAFRDAARPAGQQRKGSRGAVQTAHTAEIQQYRDEISALREAARLSREELQSSNEELQSMNEELQSTNEELTTSKEEMQSMNEELQTINNELNTKLDDLALAQSDMQNVLNSIEIAIVFLDQDLNIRRYTERASDVFKVRESDIGRPLSDLTTELQYPQLHDDAASTLQSLRPTEKQIRANDDRWFLVRIMPYRRLDNVIDGVVITLFDISEAKTLEKALRGDSQP